ncbi:MAG: hypothetical protein IPP77_15115 [Bacteroidetes bacterium]|nr:hypothetical protein [Bacteroidota bacterium]
MNNPIVVNYVSLKDINGTSNSFTANNSQDLGNNSGWTINTSASQNLYWIGNAGNWSDGNHWSLTSGGTPYGCVPTTADNVFCDVNSFSVGGQTVTIDVPTANCHNMTWTGVANTPTFAGPSSNTLKIYGSLTFVSGMNLTFAGPVNFEAISIGKTITAGEEFQQCSQLCWCRRRMDASGCIDHY